MLEGAVPYRKKMLVCDKERIIAATTSTTRLLLLVNRIAQQEGQKRSCEKYDNNPRPKNYPDRLHINWRATCLVKEQKRNLEKENEAE
jgi:hypothetical protein